MRVLTLLIGATLLASPVLAQDDVEAAIAEASEAWQAGWNAGDAAAIASLYAPDARLMAPGAEPVEGREAIEAAFGEHLAEAAGGQTTLETVDLVSEGDLTVEVGSYASTAADGSHVDHGKYIAVWKNVDGEWKIIHDIWNSSM